jgi:hypothetical protein
LEVGSPVLGYLAATPAVLGIGVMIFGMVRAFIRREVRVFWRSVATTMVGADMFTLAVAS